MSGKRVPVTGSADVLVRAERSEHSARLRRGADEDVHAERSEQSARLRRGADEDVRAPSKE